MINIDELIKKATLDKDKVALNAYRNIKAEFEQFKYAQKLTRKIDEETELRLIANYSKKLEDAIKQFSEARKDDLVSSYTAELEIVKKLLPASATTSEIMLAIWEWAGDRELLEQFNENPNNFQVPKIPKKEMGNVIKYLKSKFPTTDGKMISEIVKKYLV